MKERKYNQEVTQRLLQQKPSQEEARIVDTCWRRRVRELPVYSVASKREGVQWPVCGKNFLRNSEEKGVVGYAQVPAKIVAVITVDNEPDV